MINSLADGKSGVCELKFSHNKMIDMNLKKENARIAGLWYLLMAMTGGFGIMYVPTSIIVAGDAAATARNIIDSGWVYRLSIICNLAGQVCFIFLGLSLNRLFEEVDPRQSKLLVTLVTAAVPIAFLNTLTLIAALMFASGAEYLSVFGVDKLHALALGSLNLYNQGLLIVQVFWGLWLLPFGILVIKSRFIPRIIGVLLVVNCFAYLVVAITQLMAFQYADLASYISIPFLAIGEFAAIFWLLIKGVRASDSVVGGSGYQ